MRYATHLGIIPPDASIPPGAGPLVVGTVYFEDRDRFWSGDGLVMESQQQTPAIQVFGLRKAFGRRPVIAGLDLTLKQGRSLVIFGSNGSGKTTLLKLLATQYRPDHGEIYVGGMSRSRFPGAIRRIIGVVAHQTMLYQHMTCQENLAFFGKMWGLDKLVARVDAALDKVGLGALKHRLVRTLSHGLQKRIAIGRAIIHDPAVLLMDEPESGLDQSALHNMGDIFRMEDGRRRTAIITTHNISKGFDWGDEVAVLSRGVISYRSNKDDLTEKQFRDICLEYMDI